jgi:hypothetical protein
MKRILLACLLLLATHVLGQIPTAPTASWVSLVAADPVTVAPGKSTTLTLLFKVNDGFHINSNKPLSELLIPTAVHFNAPTDIMLAKITYPEGSLLELPFSEEKLSVYSGEFKVTSMVKPAPGVRPGTYRVHSDLKYQACNNRQCFPPKTIPFEFDVKVVKAAAKKRHNPAQSPHIKQ